MPSHEYNIDGRSRVGSRFIADVREELQRALFSEKQTRKVTQQAIADKLGVNRSVVNRQFMGLENITIRRAAELLWAIGWEAHFEARKPDVADGDNEPAVQPIHISVSSATTGAALAPAKSSIQFEVRTASEMAL